MLSWSPSVSAFVSTGQNSHASTRSAGVTTLSSSHDIPFNKLVLSQSNVRRVNRSNEGCEYLGLKLDDPSFNAPIHANLFDDEDGESHSLIWSRPNGRRGD